MSKYHEQLYSYLFKNKLNQASLIDLSQSFSVNTIQHIIKDLNIKENIRDKLYIFSDGNCKGNGKEYAKAGYSVYFGNNEIYSIFNKTKLISKNTTNVTNNVAELSGIKLIYKTIYQNQSLFKNNDNIICTDSQYSISCISKWSDNWIKNNWINSKGEVVKNKDLIKEILVIKNSIPKDINITFKHVYGHTKEPNDKKSLEWSLWFGNNKVDGDINKLFDIMNLSQH